MNFHPMNRRGCKGPGIKISPVHLTSGHCILNGTMGYKSSSEVFITTLKVIQRCVRKGAITEDSNKKVYLRERRTVTAHRIHPK